MDKNNFIEFIKIAEKLKTEIRHSWTSDINRKESVAEHSWMTSLLALLAFQDKKNEDLDKLKVLKFIIIHDLAESITGDIPYHDKKGNEEAIYNNEDKAINEIASKLGGNFGKELLQLWHEYEEQETKEAKFVKALDKIEVGFQRNIASFKTWDDADLGYPINYAEKYAKVDPVLEWLNEINMEWRKKKISEKI